MNIPAWIEKDINNLPADFTGRITLECWEGGVSRRDITDIKKSPRGIEPKK